MRQNSGLDLALTHSKLFAVFISTDRHYSGKMNILVIFNHAFPGALYSCLIFHMVEMLDLQKE